MQPIGSDVSEQHAAGPQYPVNLADRLLVLLEVIK